jgi:hypothetical protein
VLYGPTHVRVPHHSDGDGMIELVYFALFKKVSELFRQCPGEYLVNVEQAVYADQC